MPKGQGSEGNISGILRAGWGVGELRLRFGGTEAVQYAFPNEECSRTGSAGRRGRTIRRLPGLVESSAAVLRPTQAGDLVLLDGELVVVGDLLVDANGLFGVDDYLLLRLDGDDLRITVGLCVCVGGGGGGGGRG